MEDGYRIVNTACVDEGRRVGVQITVGDEIARCSARNFLVKIAYVEEAG
jgi:hypothetical protein